jgi:hypothetical protein
LVCACHNFTHPPEIKHDDEYKHGLAYQWMYGISIARFDCQRKMGLRHFAPTLWSQEISEAKLQGDCDGGFMGVSSKSLVKPTVKWINHLLLANHRCNRCNRCNHMKKCCGYRVSQLSTAVWTEDGEDLTWTMRPGRYWSQSNHEPLQQVILGGNYAVL